MPDVTVSEEGLNKWLDERDDARTKLRQLGILVTNLCKENEKLKALLLRLIEIDDKTDSLEDLGSYANDVISDARELLNPKPAEPKPSTDPGAL